MKKLLLLTFSFIAYNSSSTLHAYSWPIKNSTNKTLLIQVELAGSSNAYFNLAKPGQTVNFSWPAGNAMAGFSLNRIKYVVVDNYLLKNADFLNADKSAVTNPRTAIAWLDRFDNKQRYPRLQAIISYRYVQPDGTLGKACFYPQEAMLNQSRSFNLVEREQNGNKIICAEILTTSLKDLWCVSGKDATAGIPARQGMPAQN